MREKASLTRSLLSGARASTGGWNSEHVASSGEDSALNRFFGDEEDSSADADDGEDVTDTRRASAAVVSVWTIS